ncbi:hypothetical protein [Streptomyces sp. SS8]
MAQPTVPEPITNDELYAYTEGLRRDPRGANPPDWRVDWADGPWPVTVYSGGRRTSLSATSAGPLSALHRVLSGSLAISRVRNDPAGGIQATPETPVPHHGPRVQMRRPVPSGGGMYPTEAYVVPAEEDLVHHYCPYRHELVCLGRTGAAALLRRTLGLAEDEPTGHLVVLATRFWKSFYKYGDFTARLAAVDAGVVLGRVLRLAEAEPGPVRLRTGFLGAAVAECLGIAATEEAREVPWAVLGFGPPAGHRGAAPPASVPAPPRALERSRRIKRSAAFDRLQRACQQPSVPPAPAVGSEPPLLPPLEPVPLAAPRRPALLDPAVLARRASRGARFTGVEVECAALSTVLHTAADALSGLARTGSGPAAHWAARTRLHCAVHRVSGVAPGWYRYQPEEQSLLRTGADADPRCAVTVRKALFAASFNPELAAFTVHVSTPLDWRAWRGPVAYREQQLAVGAAMEAITLAAAAERLCGHPVLGFDADLIDRAYRLVDSGHGVQGQICVGAVRTDPHWEMGISQR